MAAYWRDAQRRLCHVLMAAGRQHAAGEHHIPCRRQRQRHWRVRLNVKFYARSSIPCSHPIRAIAGGSVPEVLAATGMRWHSNKPVDTVYRLVVGRRGAKQAATGCLLAALPAHACMHVIG